MIARSTLSVAPARGREPGGAGQGATALAMSGNSAIPQAQQPRTAGQEPAAAHARSAQGAIAGAAAQAIIMKPFVISKDITTRQRRAERQIDPSGSITRQQEFGMCPHASARNVACNECEVAYCSQGVQPWQRRGPFFDCLRLCMCRAKMVLPQSLQAHLATARAQASATTGGQTKRTRARRRCLY